MQSEVYGPIKRFLWQEMVSNRGMKGVMIHLREDDAKRKRIRKRFNRGPADMSEEMRF
jgi:hypothetical protein